MGKATGGLVQHSIWKRRAERQKFKFCSSVEICILVESFGFDLPAIAKPQNVGGNLVTQIKIY